MTQDEIFNNVVAAMQPAEELGGPEQSAYLLLMSRIMQEASRRIDAFLDHATIIKDNHGN